MGVSCSVQSPHHAHAGLAGKERLAAVGDIHTHVTVSSTGFTATAPPPPPLLSVPSTPRHRYPPPYFQSSVTSCVASPTVSESCRQRTNTTLDGSPLPSECDDRRSSVASGAAVQLEWACDDASSQHGRRKEMSSEPAELSVFQLETLPPSVVRPAVHAVPPTDDYVGMGMSSKGAKRNSIHLVNPLSGDASGGYSANRHASSSSSGSSSSSSSSISSDDDDEPQDQDATSNRAVIETLPYVQPDPPLAPLRFQTAMFEACIVEHDNRREGGSTRRVEVLRHRRYGAGLEAREARDRRLMAYAISCDTAEARVPVHRRVSPWTHRLLMQQQQTMQSSPLGSPSGDGTTTESRKGSGDTNNDDEMSCSDIRSHSGAHLVPVAALDEDSHAMQFARVSGLLSDGDSN